MVVYTGHLPMRLDCRNEFKMYFKSAFECEMENYLLTVDNNVCAVGGATIDELFNAIFQIQQTKAGSFKLLSPLQ